MAWVRYDDGFHEHDKVLPLRAGCVEALALHVLANAWTSRSDEPGYVPLHLPGLLVGNKGKAQRWAAALVEVGLWDVEGAGGWRFHNHEKYRADRSRQTPGTPAQLSAVRAAAGALGGAQGVANRAANRAATVASAAAASSKTRSKPCSPVPVLAPNGASPEPEPKSKTSLGKPRTHADDFGMWYNVYPRHIGRPDAERAYVKACRTATPSELLEAAKRFAADSKRNQTAPEFIPHPASWLNKGRWTDEPAKTNGRPQPGQAGYNPHEEHLANW